MSHKDNVVSFPRNNKRDKKLLDDLAIENAIDDVLDENDTASNLINCPECLHRAAHTATTCPNCHHPILDHFKQIQYEKNWAKSRRWVIASGVVALGGLYLSYKIDLPLLHTISNSLIVLLILFTAFRKFQLMQWKEKGFITENRFWTIEWQHLKSLRSKKAE